MKKRKLRLGELQLRILRILWDQGSASVAGMHEALGDHGKLAYTTVATMLRKMEERGLVDHATSGRRYIYRARVAEDDVTQNLVDDLLERLFEGNLASLVSHLLSSREVSRAELDELEKLVEARRRQDR